MPKKKDRPLNDRMAAFPDEFIIDLDKTAAARRVGYSNKSASMLGKRCYDDPRVRKLIDEKLKARSERTGITADNVLKEIAGSGFANIRDIFDEQGRLLNIHDLPKEVSASIASIKVITKDLAKKGKPADIEYVTEIKMVSKDGSLRDLGKHLKLFTDKIEHTGAVIVRMNNKALRPEDEAGWLKKLTK